MSFCSRYCVVIGVWIFIVLDFSIYFPLFLPALYEYDKLVFYIITPLFIWCTLMSGYCYYKSIFTSPGSPPENINDSYDDLEAIKIRSKQQQQIKKNKRKLRYMPKQQQPEFDQIQALGRTSYCFKCERIKQPRTHHCKICGICVIRMDHHCPWIGNCVGLYNHKPFIQFLFGSSLGLMIIFISITIDFFMGQVVVGQLGQIQQLLVYCSCIASGFSGLAIGFLFSTQMYGLIKNVTTIESFTEFMMQRQPFRKDTFSQNFNQIMGKSSWFIPSAPFRTSRPYTSI